MSKGKIDKLDFTKLNAFLLWKTLKREDEKTNYRLGENNCKPPDKGLVSRIYEEFSKQSSKNSQNTASKDTRKLDHSHMVGGQWSKTAATENSSAVS